MVDLHWAEVLLRIVLAGALGGAIGAEREIREREAGLRTHMLVSLGTALFVVGAAETGMQTESLTRILQGIATGIGFLGGGAILKMTDQREVHGLTTAAGIWMTAAASAIAGLGQITVAVLGTVLGLLVLTVFRRLETRFGLHDHADRENHSHTPAKPHREDDE